MSQSLFSCVICGCFTLRNGTISVSALSLEYSDVVIYDTEIRANSGPPMNAKLYISGCHTFPDGSVICAIAKGGPVHPFGFMMHVSSIISLRTNPPLYRDVLRRSRVSVIGGIVSEPTTVGNEVMYFDVETLAHFCGTTWHWIMKYVPYVISYLLMTT